MLRNRRDIETGKLKGVQLAIDPAKLEPNRFTRLANWIPARVNSLKKKRGVLSLSSPAQDAVFPETCIACDDDAPRGQQVLEIETAFDQATTWTGLAGNLRTSWGHISNGELYSLIGEATCGAGNMTYGNDCCQINHYINDVAALNEAILIPDITGASNFVNVKVGVSDVPVWAANSNAYGGLRVYYDLGLTHVDYATPANNGGGHNVGAFAIEGNDAWFYISSSLDSLVAKVQFAVFNKTSGVQVSDFYTFGATDDVVVTNMQLTDNYLYCLGNIVATGVNRLYRINRSNGTIDASLNVTALSVQFVCVANDNLVYLLCNGTPSSVYYVENFSTITFIGHTQGQGFVPFAGGTGVWKESKLYYGSSGFGGFTTDVFKIQIACPPNSAALVIAQITAASTVAAGASIAFSWEDILVPAANDTVVMKPAPAAGVLGLAGSTIATFTNSSALASGSDTLAVPGGTTPGNYVLMYKANGVWAATSNVFTVT